MAAGALLACLLLLVPLPAEEALGDGQPGLRIRYLGSGGLSIRDARESILTAPFFSNPGLGRVLFMKIAPDPERLPAWIDDVTRDARAILVGHSHYDHLMDLPLLAERLPAGAVIYGSETAAHILAASPLSGVAVESLNDRAGTSEKAGPWIRAGNGSFRFMAIRSDHAPHVGKIRLYDGSYTADLEEPPRHARDYVLGLPMSFVIDHLDPETGAPDFRIFYQDAATSAPVGFPPPLGDGRGFDLAVLCVASYYKVDDYPEGIIERTRPRALLLLHWEDFFRPQSKPIRPVRSTPVDEFIRRVEAALPEGSTWHRLDPGGSLTLPFP
jgi:L-ascorbate metabolism protein UlaG (beta-lactamase superfamily)